MNKNINWHSLDKEEIFKQLETSLYGLKESEVYERTKLFGKNILPGKKSPSLLVIFFRQFLNPLLYVLFAAALIALVAGSLKDAVFIMVVILINACLGAFQEWKAERSSEKLRSMVATMVKVFRDGNVKQINSEDLVPGDVVILESGDKVPADLRVIEAKEVFVNEALLTGESVPVQKSDKILSEEAILAERANSIFAGTMILKGRARAVVVETASNTQIGKLAIALSNEEAGKTPLIIRMEKFAKQLTIIIVLVCVFVAVHGVINGNPPQEMLFYAISLAVAAIPESLPIALTVVLSVASNKMSKRKVNVRQLAAVESLGSCTQIATDKTGTLTLNKQLPEVVFMPDDGTMSLDKIISGKKNFERIVEVGVMASEANLDNEIGDQIDLGFLRLAKKFGLNISKNVLDEIPYESEKAYAAALVRDGNNVVFALKGSVEKVLSFCQVGDKRQEIISELDSLSGQGYRLIAIAEKVFSDEKSVISENDFSEMKFLGMVGFTDPIRKEVPKAILECRAAGIDVRMITGDHSKTAFNIASKLGITSSYDEVVTGQELEQNFKENSPLFYQKIKASRVFARVTPAQKLQIVEALQKEGEFVAVTGDGANDSLALKKANIGVALGTGSDIAKETSGIVIMDDNFASLVAGIEEGRVAYDNLRKITNLVISTSISQIVLATVSAISNLPQPLLAVQLLWLNLITNGIRDIGLSFEGAEQDLMARKPRSPKENIMNATMLKQTLLAGIWMGLVGYFSWDWMMLNGYGVEYARTVLLLLFVIMLNFHTLNCRSENKTIFGKYQFKNWILWSALAVALLLHIFAKVFTPLADLLALKAFNLGDLIWVMPLSLSVILVMELQKMFFRKK